MHFGGGEKNTCVGAGQAEQLRADTFVTPCQPAVCAVCVSKSCCVLLAPCSLHVVSRPPDTLTPPPTKTTGWCAPRSA